MKIINKISIILLLLLNLSCAESKQKILVGKWSCDKFYSPDEEKLYTQEERVWRQNEFNKIKSKLFFDFESNGIFTFCMPNEKTSSGKWELDENEDKINFIDTALSDRFSFNIIQISKNKMVLEAPVGPKDRFELTKKE